LWKDECQQFCDNPQHNGIYKDFPIEKQFEYYRTCPCWGDSISNTGFYIETLLKQENVLEFLITTLKTEDDPDVLADALVFLGYVGDRKYNNQGEDIRGRRDIAELAKKTVAKIPEKDERDLWDKIYGRETKSRKERLQKIAKKIEEQTKFVYEVEVKVNDGKGETNVKE
jgi:hypothetical protein